ncbi:uncharacterized protein LOC131956091 isoform X2 [Physella acuta]|uniref:uncharacterized protein LOC131956091 isoform X1 n=1 Tax=Physella acuta TaxID=109671 RepID=UPI0027DB4391|nr:uncharacterized protein LOC131956091 isoform X1 [Physella acuta]XP_059176475.1 uncharacterized protein LOC131956091 isoform X2 [Physella acuta]
MGMCCSFGRRQTGVEPCQGHHSFYFHPEGPVNSGTYNIVYRPPHLNERLAPGEAKPRFWVNPSTVLQNPAMVSVAWCQLCQPQHLNPARQTNKRLNQRKPNKVEPHVEVPLTCHDVSMEGGDKTMTVKAYPNFILPYVNKCLRIRLVFLDPKVEQLVGEYSHLKHARDTDSDPMTEMSHLVRNLHSLKLHLKYSHVVQGLPEVTLEENHGGIKRLKRVRYRSMPVNWIDLDHRKPRITIVGEQFELTLGPPCPALTAEDFPDGNGETPTILGTYVRALDTCPRTRLTFSARLYQWFNQATPAESHSDASSNQ